MNLFRQQISRLGHYVLVMVVVFLWHPAYANPDGRMDALIADLTPAIAEGAIRDIEEPARKLLALRSYLRAGKGLSDRWSWTEEEIAAFQGSPEQAALLEEIDRIKTHFAEQNPGYELYTNTRVRSLDVQIEHWNENESVSVAAQELLAALQTEFLSAEDEPLDRDRLSHWLRGFRNTERAHLAAPGLTRHGRAHAIDFQIKKDGSIYAGADSDKIDAVWRAEGWDKALKTSTLAAGPSFTGPLTSPDEPWHYDYDPLRELGAATASDD